MTENKDAKEGMGNGNVTSISVSDDTQAQTVSKVPLIKNHMFVSFSCQLVHNTPTNRFTWVERRAKRFG